MGYSHAVYDKNVLGIEYSRFALKLVFSVIMILLLSFIGFLYTTVILAGFLIVSVIFFKYFGQSKNKIIQKILSIEQEYGENIAGKETKTMLLAFIATFVLVFILSYFILFPLEWSLVLGFMVFGVGNNFASMILYFKKKQFFIYGTTLEFFLLGTLVNFLLLWFFGLPWFVALFIALGVSLFLILPWLDHNITTVLITAVLYLSLFI